MGETGNLLLK